MSLSADGTRLTVGSYTANEGKVKTFQLESLDGTSVDHSAPLFLSSSTAPPLDEGSGSGQVVYTAISADESAVTYSLKASNADDADHFTIDSIPVRLLRARSRLHVQLSRVIVSRL